MKLLLKTTIACCLLCTQNYAQMPAQIMVDSAMDGSSGVELLEINAPKNSSLQSPSRYGDRLYFTIIQPTKTGTTSRIYSSIGKEAAQSFALNPKEEQVSIANLAFNTSANRIYYTQRREPKPGNTAAHSDLWYCNKNFDGKWGKSDKLPSHINVPGSSIKEPAIGFDFKAKKEVLFFSSDRPGGKGGYDIWYCTIEPDGRFGEPVNFPFNTTANEVAPYYFNQKQLLFYASNAITGLGGYDIYQANRFENGEWIGTENLEQINTRFDETCFFHHPQTNTNYFCSNRPNANCKDKVHNCTDFSIYTAQLGGNLLVNITNEADNTALSGCNIELEDVNTGQIKQTILKSEASNLRMPIQADKRYRLIVSREGFFPVFIEMQTTVSNCFQTLLQKIVMKPMR